MTRPTVSDEQGVEYWSIMILDFFDFVFINSDLLKFVFLKVS